MSPNRPDDLEFADDDVPAPSQHEPPTAPPTAGSLSSVGKTGRTRGQPQGAKIHLRTARSSNAVPIFIGVVVALIALGVVAKFALDEKSASSADAVASVGRAATDIANAMSSPTGGSISAYFGDASASLLRSKVDDDAERLGTRDVRVFKVERHNERTIRATLVIATIKGGGRYRLDFTWNGRQYLVDHFEASSLNPAQAARYR